MRENLIAIAQRYADATGLALTTVSKQIHGKQSFLSSYARGEVSMRIDTYFSMVNRLRQRWPKKTPWPRTASMPRLGKKVDVDFTERD